MKEKKLIFKKKKFKSPYFYVSDFSKKKKFKTYKKTRKIVTFINI